MNRQHLQDSLKSIRNTYREELTKRGVKIDLRSSTEVLEALYNACMTYIVSDEAATTETETETEIEEQDVKATVLKALKAAQNESNFTKIHSARKLTTLSVEAFRQAMDELGWENALEFGGVQELQEFTEEELQDVFKPCDFAATIYGYYILK